MRVGFAEAAGPIGSWGGDSLPPSPARSSGARPPWGDSMAALTRPAAAASWGTPTSWASDDSHNTELGSYFGPADQNGS